MKKNLIAAAIATGVALFAVNAFAVDGTVNFNGEIIDDACEVDIGSGNTMTVDLGRVARTTFTGAGSKASTTKFELKFKNCPATVTGTAVKFEGIGYDGDDSVLKLTQDSGVATGVAIELADKSMQKLPLFTASAVYPLITGDNKLPFYARYVAMSDTVTAGPANSVAQFTLNYN